MYEINVLTDEEFYNRKKENRRKSFLQELEQMSKPTKTNSFSVKDVKKVPIPKSEEKPSLKDFSSENVLFIIVLYSNLSPALSVSQNNFFFFTFKPVWAELFH